MEITYEVSDPEPLHPDPQINQRFVEMGISACEHGCKIYGDPFSAVRVVGHSRVYGCRK